MKIAHLCLSCFYIDDFSYQENELVRQHVTDGHDVVVIASTENYDKNGNKIFVKPSTYVGSEGCRVIRLPYRKFLPERVMRKLRMHPRVYELLQAEAPDAVVFHGLCGWELQAAARYKREHPSVPVYADSHEDHNNSARTFLARNALHRLFYRPIIKRCMRDFDKILCISLDTTAFVNAIYGVPSNLLEFYPLGGRIFGDAEYAERRARGRAAHDIANGDIVLLQTGKMGRPKRLLESLAALANTSNNKLKLVLAGLLQPDIKDEALSAIASDKRVKFLGWKEPQALFDLLCAADVYLQPGTQSATMQMSLCARCPVVLHDVPSHRPFVDGNGWLIQDPSELPAVLKQIGDDPAALKEKAAKSLAIARKLLDYRTLAARVLHL